MNIFQNTIDTKNSYGLKILMHSNIYINQEYLNFFQNYFINSPYFSVSFDTLKKSFHLKTKKTNIKKDYDYKHDSMFYNNFVLDMFKQFFSTYKYQLQMILDYNAINLTIDQIISNDTLLSTLYSIIPMHNNTTIVNL